MKELLRITKFLGETQPTDNYVVSSKRPFFLRIINSQVTSELNLDTNELSDFIFIGEALEQPINLSFTALGREIRVSNNRLYYSIPFGQIEDSDDHYKNPVFRSIEFNTPICGISYSPSGEVPKWAIYISTTDYICKLVFDGTKPVVQRLLDVGVLNCIGVTTLQRPVRLGEVVYPSGKQIVLFPTSVGLYIATESDFINVSSHFSSIFSGISAVHIATSIRDDGQYIIFLNAILK